MGKIKEITSREILDSRGVPTIEGKIVLDNGIIAYTQVPSAGNYSGSEGKELRDHDPTRYSGFGVKSAVQIINQSIAPKLIGVDTGQAKDIDAWLLKADGTNDCSKLGVNTMLTISLLVLKVSALEQGTHLFEFIANEYNKRYENTLHANTIPTPIFTLMNGGKHGNNNLDFQEFQIISPTSTPFNEALERAVSLRQALNELFQRRNAHVSISDEGGYIPRLSTNTEAFDIIQEVALLKGYKLGVDIYTGVDCAAQGFFKNSQYTIKDRDSALNSDEYVAFIDELSKAYNILTLEDPLAANDVDSWTHLTKIIGDQTFVIGDSLIAGQKNQLEKLIKKKTSNAVIIKLNQVATFSQILAFAASAKELNQKIIIGHRMGETTDDFIADMAVGLQAEFIKFGSPARGERIQKYNRLLTIQDLLAKSSISQQGQS